ncbi:hypothetical protein O3P69_020188 [Scylla paramamosain]|uniref:Uncharacterized protein n=1 Tax=Scylla paramamosain TaxID=85552 RepID=A0AAW0TL22_SCYPA
MRLHVTSCSSVHQAGSKGSVVVVVGVVGTCECRCTQEVKLPKLVATNSATYNIDDAVQDTQPPEDDFQTRQPDVEEKDDEAEQQSSSTRSSTACKPPVRRAPKRKATSNLVEEALAVLTKPDDECDTFGPISALIGRDEFMIGRDSAVIGHIHRGL